MQFRGPLLQPFGENVAYVLRTPTQEIAYTNHILLSRYPVLVGISLLITSGVATQVSDPSQDEVDAADYYFGGGRDHILTDAEYAVVNSAGYGSYVSVE